MEEKNGKMLGFTSLSSISKSRVSVYLIGLLVLSTLQS